MPEINQAALQAIQPELTSGESVLWAGQPSRSVTLFGGSLPHSLQLTVGRVRDLLGSRRGGLLGITFSAEWTVDIWDDLGSPICSHRPIHDLGTISLRSVEEEADILCSYIAPCDRGPGWMVAKHGFRVYRHASDDHESLGFDKHNHVTLRSSGSHVDGKAQLGRLGRHGYR